MERVTSILVGLTIPLAAIAIALGGIAVIRATLLMKHGEPLRRSPAAEGFAMSLCALCATAAVLMAVGQIRDGNYIVLSIALVQLAFAAGGLAFYFTSRRPLSEAFAAIAMGIFSILTGFSVGALIAPFAVAMGVLASHHLRLERRHEVRGDGATSS